eukprot:Phypoly_transcript_03957.p1 GENE.Phypoly_transcript_03957~~Phypoly_transcript_03957.p1  ORF type:complete len:684 (+),score=176.74 Phypoly_transcript_03957:71-2122(+)
METLLIVVIALAGVLGLVLLVSVSSILFVQSRYKELLDAQREDEEARERERNSVVNATPYVPHSVYNVPIPRIDNNNAYTKLEEIFLRDPGGTVQMTEAFHPHTMEEVAQALVVLFEANDAADVLIKHFIDLEMTKANASEGPTTLFRRDSVASKVMRFYTKLIGQQYLISILWPNIRYVCLHDDMIEIDPNKMNKGDDLEDHLANFQDVLANFLEAIVNSVPLCPPQLRAICQHLNAKANQFFPDNDLKVVSGFIFLRFFTPAIICPNAYGILEGDLTPNQSRTLLLVAKVLMNMANGVLFGAKEQFMMPLNEFLVANTSLVKGFLADLAAPDANVTSMKAFSVSTDSKFTALKVLHANLVRSFPKFKRDKYPYLYDKTQKLLRDLSDERRLSSRPSMNPLRRVSVSLLRADSGQNMEQDLITTPSSAELPSSVSLQSIALTTSPSTSQTNLQPSDLQPASPRRATLQHDDVAEPHGEKEKEDGEKEKEGEDEGEEDEEEEEEGGKREESREKVELLESSASLLPYVPSSPTPLLPKSKSGASLPKSKSGTNLTAKKRKNTYIPNERLYRPSSASSKPSAASSISSFSSFSTIAPSPSPSSLSSSPSSSSSRPFPMSPLVPSSSSSSPRSTSPMKSAVKTAHSPRLPRSFSPSISRPSTLAEHPMQPNLSQIHPHSLASPPR